MKDLTINPEFRDLIPPISREELQELEESISNEGCRDAIVVWNDTILDGHNRYEICHRHQIGFTTIEKEFDSKKEAKIWIIRNQLARRNLSLYERGRLALLLKPVVLKNQLSEIISENAPNPKSDQRPKEKKRKPTTLDTLAKLSGVGHNALHQVEVIEKKAPPEIKEAVKKGHISVNKAYHAVKERGGVKRRMKLGPPSFGMQFARMAIMDLERIQDNDLERDQAFAFVKQWIEKHEGRI
jgi:hypothetical protein